MAGIAQVWLTEDELAYTIGAVRRALVADEHDMATRRAVLDKLRPLLCEVSCDVSAEGGVTINGPEEKVGKRFCPGDYLPALK